MRRMPISDRDRSLWSPEDVPRGRYAVLDGISPAYPPVRGRLHTCYSPVRRSPAEVPKHSPAAPRLACVKPVASVHPEPGSNSPLLVSYLLFFQMQIDNQFCLLLPSRSARALIAERFSSPVMPSSAPALVVITLVWKIDRVTLSPPSPPDIPGRPRRLPCLSCTNFRLL